MITVTAAIIEKNGLILAAKRKQGLHLAGYWEFPGGKLEDGEEPEKCLQRELQEEFGIQSTVTAYLGESIFNYDEKSIRLLGYLTEHTGGEFTLTEHDEIRWLLPSELRNIQWAPADIPLVDELIDKTICDKTLNYYENNAEGYIQETLKLDIEEIRNSFISQVPPKAHILDLGCGSGRDSRVFLNRGFRVTAIDPSESVGAITSKFLDQEVQIRKAQEIIELNHYDAIWACASLLHVPKSTIPAILKRLVNALTTGGLMYISFKQGNEERWDEHGRFFNDYSLESITEVIAQIQNIQHIDITTNNSILRGHEQTWLNIFLKKKTI